jgi:hypothetical protein
MSENLKDILSHLNPEIDQQTLLQYLEGQLSAGKQHELEKQLLESDFEQEALEGLEQFRNKQDLSHLVTQLNQDLRRKTDKRLAMRNKRKLRTDNSIWIAVVLVLLLVTLAYYVIHLLVKG